MDTVATEHGEGAAQDTRCRACMSIIHPQATVCPQCQQAQTVDRWHHVGTVFKWIGGVTAVLSLLLIVGQVRDLVKNVQRKQAALAELVSVGNLQREYGDYPAAWQSYAQALELDPGHERARAEQIVLAQVWLDNIRDSQSQSRTFTETVNTLLPALHRGVVRAKGARKATLIAYLGWADFLRRRDGQGGLDPAAHYHRALALDPENAYAHVMLGHWLLWPRGGNGGLEEAQTHFKRALARVPVKDKAAKEALRELQLAALKNRHDPEFTAALLQVVNEMRIQQEAVPPGIQLPTSRSSWAYCQQQITWPSSISSLRTSPIPRHAPANTATSSPVCRRRTGTGHEMSRPPWRSGTAGIDQRFFLKPLRQSR